MRTKRGFFVWDQLGPWIIGILVLVIGLIGYAILSGKFTDGWNYFKDLWRFGR